MQKLLIAVCICAALFALCLCAGCSAKQTAATVTDGVIQETGTYKVAVTLEGGSGRATIESPATVKVDQTGMTATIVWSSSNYDLMVVDGTEYRPTSTTNNATFDIPVASLDTPLAVEAETTAMGTPHLIEYTITFDSSSAKAA